MAATMTGLTGRIALTVSITTQKSLDQSTPSDSLSYSYEESFTFGAGALQMNSWFHDSRSLAGGANETLDLANAANTLKDAFGDVLNLANVKVLIIENTSTNAATSIAVGAAAATAFDGFLGDASDVVNIMAGEVKILVLRTDADGYTTTSKNNLKITNSDGVNAATYNILVGGDSN